MIYRLTVDYKEKDTVKALGARWNPVGRFWYCEELTEALRPWYREKEGAAAPSSSPEQKQLPEDPRFAAYHSVTKVCDMIRRSFETTPAFVRILVKGEVSNYNGVPRPHYYFSIKDEQSVLACRLWAETAAAVLDFPLENGKQLALAGRLEFYGPRGEASLIVSEIYDMGAGAEALALLKLKEKLQAEGLFDPALKKAIPRHPRQVGILTSRDGQAIKDICAVARRRNPYVQLVLYPVNVQGKNALSSLLEGLHRLDERGLDSLIIGRGGGSSEDLSAFNQEALIRAVAGARTPLISAVGHEGHWTLIDYVSDERAATPSEAAEKAVPDIMSDIRRLKGLEESLQTKMRLELSLRKGRLDTQLQRLKKNDPALRLREQTEKLKQLTRELNRNFGDILAEARRRLTGLEASLPRAMEGVYSLRMSRWELLTARLAALSPAAKLVGGFAYISAGGRPLRNTNQVTAGERLEIRLHDGRLDAEVKGVYQGSTEEE